MRLKGVETETDADAITTSAQKLMQKLRPISVETFLRSSLELWGSSSLRDAKAAKVLVRLLASCADVLGLPDDGMNPEVRETICVNLERMVDVVVVANDEVRDAYFDAVARMPMANVDRLSSPVRFWEVSLTIILHLFRATC